MATMDPEVVIMPSDRPSIIGREAIRHLSQNYAAAFDEPCSVAYDEVEAAGNWGFARARVTGTRIRNSDGAVEEVLLRNLWILKRQADGEWKFWRIMFNQGTSAQASSSFDIL